MDLMSTAQLMGNFGEFFGAIVVVVTLVYLARQIRQNSNQIKLQADMQFVTSLDGTDRAFSSFRQLLIINEDVCAIWNKAIDNFDSLTGNDRTRADQLLMEFYVIYHNLYLRFRPVNSEYFGVSVEQELARVISPELEHASVRTWWWQNKHRISTPEFVDLMSGIVREQDEKYK